MRKALIISTTGGFLAAFERNDIHILQELGYEVHCACNLTKINQTNYSLLEATGALLHHVGFERNPLNTKNIQAYKQLVHIMKSERFSLVHCHTPVGGVLGRIVAHKVKVPIVIYTAHGFHFFKGAPLKNWLFFYPVEKWLAKYTDVLITINNEDFERAKHHFHSGRVVRIHGVGIDLGRFAKSSSINRDQKREELGVKNGEKLLLSVGELDKDKNHMRIIHVMKDLSQLGYKLAIAGDGALLKKYNDYLTKNNLEDSVSLLGYRYDIRELLNATDVFVFPSLFEGVSVALMEAVAAHIPIACSKVRGNVDTVVSEESFFSPYSEKQIKSAIQLVSSLSDEQKNQMTFLNYNNLQLYQISNVHNEMNEIYKSVSDMAN